MEYCRASATSVALETGDGKIVVQRRKPGLLAGGMLESSAAGMVVVKDGKLDFVAQAYAKLKSELGLSQEDLSELTPIGCHSSRDYGSAQITFSVKTPKPFPEVEPTVNRGRVPEIFGVPKSELISFIMDHYVKKEEMNGDGPIALLRVLPLDDFQGAIREINRACGNIRYGMLVKGNFVERV